MRILQLIKDTIRIALKCKPSAHCACAIRSWAGRTRAEVNGARNTSLEIRCAKTVSALVDKDTHIKLLHANISLVYE